jgi:hypothetical protein
VPHDQWPAANGRLDDPPVAQHLEGHGDRGAALVDADDTGHGREPLVGLAGEQERRGVDVVVAGVGVGAVAAVETRVAAEHPAGRVGSTPVRHDTVATG